MLGSRSNRLPPIPLMKLLLTALSVFFLCACSSGLSDKVSKLEKQIVQLRNRQAEYSSQLEEQRSTIAVLTGKVEEIEFSSQGQVKKMAQTIKQFSSRVPPPAGVPADILELDEEEISKYSTEAALIFKDGLAQIRSADFTSALDTFKSFLSSNPNTRFSDNALFWQGVAHEKLGQYDLAIISYNEVFSQFPAEDRAAVGLFRLAGVFEKLGTKDSREDAAASLEKLLEDYPNSKFATPAKKRIKKLRR